MQDFNEKLQYAQSSSSSMLCIGLDPDPRHLPRHLLNTCLLPDAIIAFNTAVIEATSPLACAYKLNFAFYEALGREGWRVLEETIVQIPGHLVVIADAKRGDIGNSARFYAEAVFTHLRCDACTVAPYMGRDAVEPFLQYEGKAAFILARTSNPGAEDFQEKVCDGVSLYERVAASTKEWASEAPGTAGLVVGAASREALIRLRQSCPDMPFLIPGVGAQGGDARMVMQCARTHTGQVIVNSSRQIIFASPDSNFAEAAGDAAMQLRNTLNEAVAGN